MAATLIELGEDLLRLDRPAEAVIRLERALEYAVRLVDPSLERSARNDLGRARTASGDLEEAIAQHELAAALAASHEDAYERARAHHGLADARRRLGDAEAERMHLLQAHDGYEASGVPEAAAVAERLRPRAADERHGSGKPAGRTGPPMLDRCSGAHAHHP